MNLKELLKQSVDDEDLLPELPRENKDENTEIVKAYKEGYEQGKKDAERLGRWIRTGEDGYCSICNCDMPMYKEDWEWRYLETPYCPNCGARMEVE